MGRTKLGGTPSSRQRYVCPVRSCKSNPRGDTWTTHWKTQVIFDDTDSGYAKDPKNVRKFCTRSERDHTQYFYDGHFSISNLPKLTIVYHNPKERVKTISDLWKKSATKRKATDTSGGESDIDEPQQDNESNEVPDSGEKKSFPQSRRKIRRVCDISSDEAEDDIRATPSPPPNAEVNSNDSPPPQDIESNEVPNLGEKQSFPQSKSKYRRVLHSNSDEDASPPSNAVNDSDIEMEDVDEGRKKSFLHENRYSSISHVKHTELFITYFILELFLVLLMIKIVLRMKMSS